MSEGEIKGKWGTQNILRENGMGSIHGTDVCSLKRGTYMNSEDVYNCNANCIVR